MPICHEHNMTRPSGEKPYGIRLTLPQGDTMARLLGPEWQAIHWYATEMERDQALERMIGKHRYSRPGDFPTYVYSKLVRGQSL
jgi:hypothetical protein